MRESRQVRPGWRPSIEAASGAATPHTVANRSRLDGDSERGGSGRFASPSQPASVQPSETKRSGSPTTNRPPETQRAGPGADAATESPPANTVRENNRHRLGVRPERTSAHLGAESVEARTARLLQGAGADVSARNVRERNGLGSPLARTMLEKALAFRRAHHRQRSSSIVPRRPRSSIRSLS
jgi:hypothetical protein